MSRDDGAKSGQGVASPVIQVSNLTIETLFGPKRMFFEVVDEAERRLSHCNACDSFIFDDLYIPDGVNLRLIGGLSPTITLYVKLSGVDNNGDPFNLELCRDLNAREVHDHKCQA